MEAQLLHLFIHVFPLRTRHCVNAFLIAVSFDIVLFQMCSFVPTVSGLCVPQDWELWCEGLSGRVFRSVSGLGMLCEGRAWR